jgi:MFS transporter, PPP family, 3-phenylpropionic acid transporter
VTAKRTTWGLKVAYVLLFMSVGITLPFLPGYFGALGLSGAQVGVLLAVGPSLAMVLPPMWGQLADRTGRGGMVLVVLCVGGAAGYGLLALADGFWGALAGLALYHVFGSSLTSQLDSLALHHVQATRRSYVSLRLWGSVGFVVSTLSFGLLARGLDRLVVLIPLALVATMAGWTAVTLAREPPLIEVGPHPGFGAVKALVQRRDVALFLAATALHWIACAPYHGLLTLHVTKLGWSLSTVGFASAVAVSSEVLVMVTWPRWGAQRPPRELLAWAFGASAVRWLILSVADRPAMIVMAATLHGLTFGAFYLAAVASMTARVPSSLRATGQSLFAAATFGAGGLIGFAGSGWLYDVLGGHRLFAVAAAVEALPLLAIWLADRRPASLAV